MMHDCNWPPFYTPPHHFQLPPEPPNDFDPKREAKLLEQLSHVSDACMRIALVEELFESALKNNAAIFENVSDSELTKREFLFGMMNQSWLFRAATNLLTFGLKLHLPLDGVVKRSFFPLFCGGSDLNEAISVARQLKSRGVNALLDRAAEGCTNESEIEASLTSHNEMLVELGRSSKNGICALKISSICTPEILANPQKNEVSKASFIRTKQKVVAMALLAKQMGVKIMIDAEESWLQDSIDEIAHAAMQAANKEGVYVFTTVQMYRHDRLEYLEKLVKASDYNPGIKIVRGAYFEAETQWALRHQQASALCSSKEKVDQAYNTAIDLLIQHVDSGVEVMIATHNRESCLHALRALIKSGHDLSHPAVQFAQLYGMSDDLTFALLKVGVNVSKYLPFGNVKEAIPYLIRRAQENSAIMGETSRELSLVRKEKYRRETDYFYKNKEKIR